jgi:hypothetical protein
MCGRSIHTAQRFQRLFRAETSCVGDHHLGQADDGVERGAQLVAHAGEELRLPLARLRELAALVLDFIEQADVFDGDHSLVGEGGEQLDLLVCGGFDCALAQRDYADWIALTQERYAELCRLNQRAERGTVACECGLLRWTAMEQTVGGILR